MENKDRNHTDSHRRKRKLIVFILVGVTITAALIWFSLHFLFNEKWEQSIDKRSVPNDEILDGIHLQTGLKEDEGLMTVVTHCTACHSAQLIIQNRMNKERWNATIRWMQETQNLWELGDNQNVIVNYLVKNYPVYNKGRRENLQNIQWYELSD